MNDLINTTGVVLLFLVATAKGSVQNLKNVYGSRSDSDPSALCK